MTNCLDLACPHCSRDDAIEIAATLWMRVTPEGIDAEAAGTTACELRPGYPAICVRCGQIGTLRDFERPSADDAHGMGEKGWLAFGSPLGRGDGAWLLERQCRAARRVQDASPRQGAVALRPVLSPPPLRPGQGSFEATQSRVARTKEKTMNKKPTLIAYAVRDRSEGQSAIWTRIGAAWPHAKGQGLSIELDALPTDGRLVLIPPKAAEGDPA